MNKIKKITILFLDFLKQEPEHKHPRLKIIPNVILNLLGLIIYITLALSIISFIIKKIH